MHRAPALAGSLLALLIVGETPPLRALPPPPPPEGCASAEDCDDGDFCNGAERCVGRPGFGVCVAGRPRVCRDLDPCTDDACVDNQCVSTPIPDCQPATTTSSPSSTTSSSTTLSSTTSSSTTVTTRASTSSTSTVTLPATTSTTRSLPQATTTTTSTTVPRAACTPSDPAGCEDGDPCTVDSCLESGTCAQVPLTGVASVACICDRTLPACQQAPPRAVARLVIRGCTRARRAATLAAPRQGVLLRRAGRAFAGAAARALGAARTGRLDPACAEALAATLREARTRATAARGER